MDIATRSVQSTAWSAILNLIRLPIGLIQSIILARLLPVEFFGIYAGMVALLMLSGAFFNFGLNDAYMHRSPETEDEQHATGVYFSLRFMLNTIWAVGLLIFAFVFLIDPRRLVLIVLTITSYLARVLDAPRQLLTRRVQQRRLAILDTITTIVVAIVSISIAYWKASLWALLASSIISLILSILLLYIWKPVWRPRFKWDFKSIKYFLNFGGRSVIGSLLSIAIDYVDDLWVNLFLGDKSLGYYSRAYRFATYPRDILTLPVSNIAQPVYSELKYDRLRLSKAFFRLNAMLVRGGFLLGGWLFLIAPQFINIFLGSQWLPMLRTFQLMLLYTLFDPLKTTLSGVIIAIGKPEKVSLFRGIQLVVLVVGLFTIGFWLGNEGVAIVIDIMVVVGVVLSVLLVKPYIQISYRRMFSYPFLGLVVGIGLTLLQILYYPIPKNAIIVLLVRTLTFGIGYIGVLIIFEREEITRYGYRLLSYLGITKLLNTER
jgi:O-antigen/teichoic acid export membrane protein